VFRFEARRQQKRRGSSFITLHKAALKNQLWILEKITDKITSKKAGGR